MFDLKLKSVKEEKTAISGKKTIFSSSLEKEGTKRVGPYFFLP
jgi:hypothetical protein